MANPRPGTHPGSEAALDSSTPTNMPLWPSAQQPATSLPCGATLVTSLDIANGSEDVLSSQKTESFFCDAERGRDAQGLVCSPAWDSASTGVLDLVPWELSNLLLLQLTKLCEQAGKLQMFSSAFYPLVLQWSARIKTFTASNRSGGTAPLWGQRCFVGLETPFTPSTSSPWPSTARQGEDLSAHSATAPRSIPSQDPTLLPKGWTRPRPACSWWQSRQEDTRSCESFENSSVRACHDPQRGSTG